MTFKFSPEQEAWLHDLETTTAPQGRGRLHDEEGYCCLGRACAVLDPEGEAKERWGTGNVNNIYPPGYIVRKLKLHSPAGAAQDRSDALTVLNDSGRTFREIAAIIRANPENYLKAAK